MNTGRRTIRVFVPGGAVGEEVDLRREDAEHLCRVLRLAAGCPIEGFDGRGTVRSGVLSALSPLAARLRILSIRVEPRPETVRFTVALAAVRLEMMDLAVQKAVELGCEVFVPLVAEYSSLREPFAQLRRRIERWERIALESLKQCRRNHALAFGPPQPAVAWFQAGTAEEKYLLHPGKAADPDRAGVGRPPAESDRVALAVGPEGGWSETEVQEALDNGFRGLDLGPAILRSETAVIAALAVLADRKRRSSPAGPSPSGQWTPKAPPGG